MLNPKFGIIIGILLFRIIINSAHAQELEIWQAQGEGVASPYQFEVVTLPENIVTARGNGFFFIQTPPERSDDNPSSSDAMLVNTAYNGEVGDLVSITGRILEIDGATGISSSGITVNTISSGHPLPPPVTLGQGLPSSQSSDIHSLERVENMLVQFSATASGPTDELELTPLSASGQRPFREPGIRHPGLPGLPVWDGNPEVFWFDPNGLNAPNNRFINAGAMVEARAILTEAGRGFWLAMPLEYAVSGGPVRQAVRDPEAGEFTIGSLNALQLFANTAATSQRLRKLARYIDEQLRLPDILALQEVGSLEVLRDLAYYLGQEAPGTDYEAYLLPGGGEINLGFLVKQGVEVSAVRQLGNNETFSQGGRLHDRPPLLLEAMLPTSPPTPIRVLNLHLRSLLGIEGPDSSFVRNKRHQQAISVANMAQALQQEGNLIVLGDFNAYEFTDGYVDVASQISGRPSLGAQLPPAPIVSPPLANQVEQLPAAERYSYVFEGNAQVLDQCLTSAMEGLIVKGMQYGRGNADNALAYFGNPFLMERASDHDGLVLFLEAENAVNTASPSGPLNSIDIQFAQPMPAGGSIYLNSRNSGRLKSLEIRNLQGQMIWRKPLQGREASVQLPLSIPAGQMYVLRVAGENGVRAERVLVY